MDWQVPLAWSGFGALLVVAAVAVRSPERPRVRPAVALFAFAAGVGTALSVAGSGMRLLPVAALVVGALSAAAALAWARGGARPGRPHQGIEPMTAQARPSETARVDTTNPPGAQSAPAPLVDAVDSAEERPSKERPPPNVLAAHPVRLLPQLDPSHARRVLGPVIATVAVAGGVLILLGLIGGNVGGGGVLVGSTAALLPLVPVVATFLWIDRWEPEPSRTLRTAFVWGAIVAGLSALIIDSRAGTALDEVLGRGSGDILGATVISPFVEEAVKGAFLIGLLIFRRTEFDSVVDGIVYAGLVAAGFAFTENVLYIGRAFAEDGALIGENGGLLSVLILRGVVTPFAHPLFTSMLGIGCGLAATSRSRLARVFYVLVGYLLAVFLHVLWSGSETLGDSAAFFGVYLFVMVPLFIAMVTLTVWQRRREQRTVRAQLPGFAQAGWIAPSEVELLGSLAGRNRWQRAVRQRSGRDVARAVKDYQAAVTKLAFLNARLVSGAISGRAAVARHAEVLVQIHTARDQAMSLARFAGPPTRPSPPTDAEPS